MRLFLMTALTLLAIPKAAHAQETPSQPTITAPAGILQEPVGETVPADNADSFGPLAEIPVYQNLFSPGRGGNVEAVGPLIAFTAQEPKIMDEMAEDLNILGFLLKRNLEKAVGEQAPEIKLGVPMLLESGGHRIHASYIDGFGVLFNLHVAVPVVAPQIPAGKVDAPKVPTEWEKARAALYGGNVNQSSFGENSWAAQPRPQHYDARVVEILKKEVIESLKSASNLRRVRPDEWIVVTVTGAPNEPEASLGSAGVGTAGGGVGTTSVQGPSRPTVMTFRVKKSAADAAVAKGGSEEQFASKVEITSYLGAETRPHSGDTITVNTIRGQGAYTIIPATK